MDRSRPSRRLLCRFAIPVLLIGASAAATASPLPMLGSCPGGPPAVVVDVGHGVRASGAVSARGRPEFQFNRELAHTIAAALARAGGHPVLLNEDGADLSLAARVTQINAANPTLLLSVHHDSVQPRYLESWQVDGRNLDYSDKFAGFSLFISRKNAFAADSERFARDIGESLTASGLTPSLHHAEPIPGENRPLVDDALGLYAFNDLAVLRGTRAPAVLLEAGIIKNRDEEQRVETPAFREQVAAAVVVAVGRYCAGTSEAPRRQTSR